MNFTKGFQKTAKIIKAKTKPMKLSVTGTPPSSNPNSMVTPGTVAGYYGGNA